MGGLVLRGNFWGKLWGNLFVFEIELSSIDETFTLPLTAEETQNFTVDWGDGSTSEITSFDDPDISHTYNSPGTYKVKINGTIGGWSFWESADKEKITNIRNWGIFSFVSTGAFKGCTNLQITATDGPTVLNLEETFDGCSSIGGVDVSKWDTSNVVNAKSTFRDATNASIKGLSYWKIPNLSYGSRFLENVALTKKEYDKILINWALQPRQSGVIGFSFGNSEHTATGPASLGKKILVKDNWKISDLNDGDYCSTIEPLKAIDGGVLDPPGSKIISFTGGVGPFIWTVTSAFGTLEVNQTAERENILTVNDPDASGTAIVIVQDETCGDSCEIGVRMTNGAWVEKSSGICMMTGESSAFIEGSTQNKSVSVINGKGKQIQYFDPQGKVCCHFDESDCDFLYNYYGEDYEATTPSNPCITPVGFDHYPFGDKVHFCSEKTYLVMENGRSTYYWITKTSGEKYYEWE
jgi:surface protein